MIKKQGKDKTVLFSSHILQEVEAICDRVIIINKGEMVADDKLSNLRKHSTIKHCQSKFQRISRQRAGYEQLPAAKSVNKIRCKQLAVSNR